MRIIKSYSEDFNQILEKEDLFELIEKDKLDEIKSKIREIKRIIEESDKTINKEDKTKKLVIELENLDKQKINLDLDKLKKKKVLEKIEAKLSEINNNIKEDLSKMDIELIIGNEKH